MKRLTLLLSFFLLFGYQSQAQTPNWAEDVSCILYTHCTGCHNPTGIAPFSLLTYNEASGLSGAIQLAVNDGEMPPWPPDPSYNPLSHERLLTAAEITTLNDWVNAGAPEGNPSLAPPQPIYTTSEVITNPDMVIVVDPYASQATTSDDYRCFVLTNPNTTDKFITGYEVVPGNPAIVHHVLVFFDESNGPANSDANEAGEGYTCFGGTGSNNSTFLGGWAPGSLPSSFPDGMGFRLPAGADFVLQIHYPEGSAGQMDGGTKINFTLSDDLSLRNVTNDFILNHFVSMTNGPLFIPANTVRTFNEEYTIPITVTVLDIFPHMHLIGTSMRSWAVKPGGQMVNLINIPEWDFEWQGTYSFRQPIVLPAGTTVYGEATYDNTNANPHNPSNPPQNVSAGEATTDEMMMFFFSFLPYQTGDENIVVDDGSHPIEYCDTVGLVLPLQLSYFHAKNENRQNSLEWQTEFELNSKHFSIERSSNQIDFEVIGEVRAKGTSVTPTVYNFIDEQPLVGTNYYRLKLVEWDGSFFYSEIKMVEYSLDGSTVLTYPNPVKDILHLETLEKNIHSVQILDATGKELVYQSFEGQLRKVELDLEHLPSGIYFVKMQYKNSLKSVTRKIVVD